MSLGSYIHPEDAEDIRLDALATRIFPELPTRSGARKAARRDELLVNDVPRRGAWWIHPGDRVVLVESTSRPPRIFPLPLDVVYEDAHVAVVVKVPGYPVNGARHRTIEHALPHNLTPTDAEDALRWPRPAHRLDAPTGGLLVVGKTRSALAALGEAFQNRRVVKRYRAILVGRLEGGGHVELPVDERDARSRWKAISHHRALRTKWVTTVDLWPLTGRTHQLRRHMASLGHPVLGDADYGTAGTILRGKGLFLWAVELRLAHPIHDRVLQLEIEEPHKFDALRQREERRWKRYHGVIAP